MSKKSQMLLILPKKSDSADVQTPDPAPALKKVVSVVPQKVREAEPLDIPLETPPEETVIPEGTIFQAIGIISGDVTFLEEEKRTTAFVTLEGKQYPLYYVPQRQKAFDALKKEIAATGKARQRIIVYPKFTHFPGRDQDYTVSFQLVGFEAGCKPDSIAHELKDGEFQLCGLWQFIPVCRTPCLSIFRNFTKERLEYIKQLEPAKKVRFMKVSHLPLFWRDALVEPFRFNPRMPKEEQGHPVFVQIKAKFVPRRNAFEFQALLSLPLKKPPKFLKVSKEDKAIDLAEKNKFKMLSIS